MPLSLRLDPKTEAMIRRARRPVGLIVTVRMEFDPAELRRVLGV